MLSSFMGVFSFMEAFDCNIKVARPSEIAYSLHLCGFSEAFDLDHLSL